MGPLRPVRSKDDVEVPAHEPKRDVVDAPGIPRETRLGRRVEEETCFITDHTVAQALQPAQLNGGNLVDIFQNREDDFDAAETVEVSYTVASGEQVQELVFAESSSKRTFTGPRILVSASRVNTMHRAISVLSRKVDNLTATLRICREHYYKELFSLRHGRQPNEEHEKFWFTPQAYQDTVSIQELRKRFGTEQEDLRKSQQEVRELRVKLRQIDSIAEERLEKIITRKTLPELFSWMRDMNGFREADFDMHVQLRAQEIRMQDNEAVQAPDLEKEELKRKLDDADYEIENLRRKLMETQVTNDGLTKLLTERRQETLSVEAPIQEEPDLDDFFSSPSSQATTPKHSKDASQEMSRRRRSQTTEDTLTTLNRRAEEAEELEEVRGKMKELQALAEAWEKEARDQSRRNVEMERANKDFARLQKQRDLAEKEATKAKEQKEILQKRLTKYKMQIESLRADGVEVESVKMSEDGDASPRRNSIDSDLAREMSRGRLNPPGKASSRSASKSSGKGSKSPKGSRSPRGKAAKDEKGRKSPKAQVESQETMPSDPFFQVMNDSEDAFDQEPDSSISFGSEAFPRPDGTFSTIGDSFILQEVPEQFGIGVSRDATLEMSSFEVSLGLDTTEFVSEGAKELRDVSVQTMMTTDPSPPRWTVLPNEEAEGADQDAIEHLLEYAKCKLLQMSVHFIKSEEPDILKISAALAAIDHRLANLGRSSLNSPSGRPTRLSTAVQRIQRMQQGNWQKVVAMEEARKTQVALNQEPPQPKHVRPLPSPLKSGKLKRFVAAATAKRWIASPSGAAVSPPGPPGVPKSPEPGLGPPGPPRRESRSLPSMSEVSHPLPDLSISEVPPSAATMSLPLSLPSMQEVQEPNDFDLEGRLESLNQAEWPRQVTENLDLLSSGSDQDPSSRPSFSEEPNREGSFRFVLFENDPPPPPPTFTSDARPTPPARPAEQVHDWTQGLPYAKRQDGKAGNGLFTAPAKPLKVNSKERWMPKVSLGGFSNLDTPSLISGQLDRFQEEFEASRSSTD